jgi:hypothetical protein
MKKFLKYTAIFWGTIVLTILLLSHVIYRFTPNDTYCYAYNDKMAMLDNPTRKPSIVLLAGSSAAYGFQSQIIVDSIGMPVINTGLTANLGLKYMLDEVPRRLKPGDILVFCPEEYIFRYKGYYGTNAFTYMFYHQMVPMSEICKAQMRSIIEQTPSYISKGSMRTILGETDHQRKKFNKYGDFTGHWVDSLRHCNSLRPKPDPHEEYYEVAFEHSFTVLKALQDRGIRIIMFCPPGDRFTFSGIKYKFSQIAKAFNRAGFKYPDETGVDWFDNEFTYDTEYHLNRKGSYIHTQRLIKWLKQNGIGAKAQ